MLYKYSEPVGLDGQGVFYQPCQDQLEYYYPCKNHYVPSDMTAVQMSRLDSRRHACTPELPK